ncbi:phage major tail tube protein [Brevundimonas faecalis]|uniref:phage major tail tube protein n=1 Tax=Brevundimonas faecalis TaxID=947378 RepID=UPI00361508D0
MNIQLPDSLKGWTAFVDGFGQAGVSAGGKLPVIKFKTDEHKDGGMDAPEDIALGMEKLEWELTLNKLSPIALKTVGRPDVPITLRGSMEDEAGNKKPVVAQLRTPVFEVDKGEWGEAKKVELKLKGTATYYRLTIGGEEIYEIDTRGLVRRIGGVDQLAQRRANLGL